MRRETPHSSALNIASMPTPRQEKVAQMLALAKECGFICQAQTEFSTQLANEISSRLMHRSAASVYQSVNFSIPLFAREAALEIFGHVAGNSEHHLNWKLTTIDACARVMDHLSKLVPSGSYLQGMSRALITDSEVTALVIAMMMPTLEATWKTMPRGGCLLKINFMYVLMDADGELHAPKNENRQELDLGDALPRALRQQVMVDVQRMIDRGVPLASGWYRQLGLTQRADAVALCEAAGTKEETAVEAKRKEKAKNMGKAGVSKKGHFNVSHIVKEVKSSGKAKGWFLVEWDGYHPSWERERINGVRGCHPPPAPPLSVILGQVLVDFDWLTLTV